MKKMDKKITNVIQRKTSKLQERITMFELGFKNDF